MGNLKSLIGEQTYQVTDCPSTRFNFYGLVPITEELLEDVDDINEWRLDEKLPEDVKRAVDTMRDNDVNLEDFTGISVFEDGEESYYLLTW